MLPEGGAAGGRLGNGTCSSGSPSCRATCARASAKRPFAASQRTNSGTTSAIAMPTGYRHRTQHRHAAPAEQVQQCRRCRRGQQRAGGREHDVEAGERGAVPRRRRLHHQREAGRHRRGEPEAHDKAQQRQHLPLALRHQPDRAGADAADERAQHELLLAAPGVGQAAPGDRAADRADTAAVQDDRRLAVRQVPLRPEHREQECDDREIEELQHGDQREQAEVDPIPRPQSRAVEQRQQGFGCLSVHGRLRLAPCLSRRVRTGRRCCEAR